MMPEPSIEPTPIHITVKIGDGAPGVPTEVLVEDLQQKVHLEAAAFYGPRPGCMYVCFTGPERAKFGELLDELKHPMKAEILQEWDEASRPIAVVHWWEDAPLVIHD